MNQTLKCEKVKPYRWVVLTSQCLGLLPVVGVRSNNFRFEWKSVRTFYNLFMSSVLGILFVFEVIYSSTQVLDEHKLNNIVTKICVLLMLLVHLKLAYRWPSLMQNWTQTERIMDIRYGCLKSFGFRVKVCLIIFLVATMAGYCNAIVYQSIYGHILKFDFYAFIFDYIPFNYPLGILLFLVYSVQSFIVNFNDIFIILTSMYIGLRFQQIRKRLEMHEHQMQVGMVDFWQELRRDYDRLSNLCLEVDDGINGLILLSFTYNMYFVIHYLFRHLMVESVEAQFILFYVFFPLLVVKMLAVCLYTSWINDESLAPVNILNSVSSRDYNAEIGRWLTQMSFDKVAFTAGKIFKITRGIFLSVTSVIVTYELVVMQFHGFSSKT